MENEWIVQVGMKTGAYRKQRTRNARPYGRERLQVGVSSCTWQILVGARIACPNSNKFAQYK